MPRWSARCPLAALPEVRPAALEDDLLRRDFTVNAMALFLGGGAGEAGGGGEVSGGGWDLGSLVDVAGGRRDLEAKALRVLHDRSFLDDPTRVLRGVRFEARLGFRLTLESEALARQAVAAGAFARLSGSRLRHEIELLLGAEPAPDIALAGLDRLGELGESDGECRFLSFRQFPWFADATIAQLSKVERPLLHHLYWPELDVDLHLESIERPESYPLVSGARHGRKVSE
jgi:tRNA nucleotidyltransferase/poly(A) polymerase